MSIVKTKIKTGDKVIITTGKDRNSIGNIKKVITKSSRVIVEGFNIVTKHTKPNPQKNIEGGLVSREAPIHISNVAIYNAETGKADKVSFITTTDGVKKRVYRSNQAPID